MFSKNRLQTSIQAFFKLLSYMMSANQCSNFSCFFCLFVLFAWCHHWRVPIYRDKVSQLGKIWTIQLSKYRKLFPRPSSELKKKKKRATNQVNFCCLIWDLTHPSTFYQPYHMNRKLPTIHLLFYTADHATEDLGGVRTLRRSQGYRTLSLQITHFPNPGVKKNPKTKNKKTP